MPPFVLANKTVVVTGANRGIGLELVKQIYAKQDNRVVATARQPAEAKELNSLARGSGGSVSIMQLDVSDEASIASWAAQLKAVAPKVDLLINNAGVAVWSDLEEVTQEEMIRLFKVNTCGPLLCTQQLVKHGLLGKGSVVVNMTSKMGSVDDNTSGGSYSYRASKAALNIVTKSLSLDLASKGIASYLAHPGWVATRMTGNSGLINTQQSAEGMLRVLESAKDASQLSGRWFAYDGKEIPW